MQRYSFIYIYIYNYDYLSMYYVVCRMQRFSVLLIVSLWGAMMCQAAPQGDPAEVSGDAAEGSSEGGEAADLTEATELMTFLKMEVK